MCWAAGTAGKSRLDLLVFKAKGISVIAFRWSRTGTCERSQPGSLLFATDLTPGSSALVQGTAEARSEAGGGGNN